MWKLSLATGLQWAGSYLDEGKVVLMGSSSSGRAAPGQEVSNKSGLPCCYAVRLLKAVTELLLGVRDTMDPLQCGMG